MVRVMPTKFFESFLQLYRITTTIAFPAFCPYTVRCCSLNRGEFMIESLLDFISLSAMYSIYGGLFLMFIHLLWIWKIEIQYISSNHTVSEETFFSIGFYKTPVNNHTNYIISWMIKCIRRKISSSSDEDGALFVSESNSAYSQKYWRLSLNEC